MTAALIAVFVAAAPAAATRGQPDQRLPFQLHLVGHDRPLDMAPGMPPFLDRSTFGGRCTLPSDWVTTIDSAGTAAHLGRVSVVQSHCTRFDFLAAPPQDATFADGLMVVTAANGDQLWIEYAGSFLFYPGATPEVGVSRISYSSVAIVGGTGRFKGASGTMVGSAVDDFPLGANIAVLRGTIVYDASNQAR